MKILHLVPTYVPAYSYGGPIRSVHSLNKWLVKNGVQVTVYTTNINGDSVLDVPLGKEVEIDGVKVFYFPYSFPRKWEYSRLMHKFLKQRTKEFDLVHIDAIFRSTCALGSFYARKFKKPYIISPRGALMLEPMRRKSALIKKIYLSLIEKKNLKEAATIHFTTDAEKEEYIKAGLPLKKSIVIPNGFESEDFKSKLPKGFFRNKFGIKDDQKIVLFFGRLNWKKGFDTLIPAFAEIIKKEPKAVLVLAGPDEKGYKKEIELKIENCKLKIGKDVIFTGMLLGEDIIAAFQDSQVFVLPSYAENFGMTVIEAMYFGLPVVISEEVGISGIVAENNAGIVVEKREENVVGAVLKILSQPALALALGENAKRLVLRSFTMPPIAERFIGIYNEVLRK